jgi:hypothetical protein
MNKMHLAIGIDTGGSQIGCGIVDKFRSYLMQSISDHNSKIHVALSELRENAAIIGMARLVDDNFFLEAESLLPKM